MKKKLFVFLVFIIFIFSTLCVGSQKISLTYSPQKRVLFYNIKIVTKTEFVLPKTNPLHRETSQISYLTGNITVKDEVIGKTKDKNTREKLTFEKVKFFIESKGQQQSLPVDTELLGKSIDMIISPLGKEIKTEGFSGFSTQLKDLKLENTFSQFTPYFPSHPVAIGDTWENSSVSNLPIQNQVIKMVSKYKYKLLSLKTINKKRCAIIEVNTQVDTHSYTAKKTSDMIFDIDMKGNGKGTIVYDYKESKTISSDITLSITSKLTTSMQNRVSTMNLKQNVKMNMSLTTNKQHN